MKFSNSVMALIVLCSAAAIAGITVSTNLTPAIVFANHEFSTNMTGQQEVPPVDTQATGEIILVQDLPLNQTIDYYLNVTGIQAATQGHIHAGAQGQNGPVVVTLFNSTSPQNEILKNGTITANDLVGPMKGKTIPDLLAAMKNGSTYVNVHTEQNPKGEIRGQLIDMP